MKKNVKNGIQEDDRGFRFYRIMNYPLPKHKEYFAYKEKIKIDLSQKSEFSRNNKNPNIEEYIEFINNFGSLYKNFPFVREIYLANSITFNALKNNSDIDIFVICESNRVWLSRLFMSCMMFIYGIKRTANKHKKKFCLSFFVDKNNCNLEKLSLGEKDIYLFYWIAHLVPLYYEKESSIYKQNTWIQSFLPNHVPQQLIFLGNKIFTGNGKFKKTIEFCLGGIFGNFLEDLVRKIWGLRIQKIIRKNPKQHEGVVVEKNVLKFYHDKRKQYSELFFSSDN